MVNVVQQLLMSVVYVMALDLTLAITVMVKCLIVQEKLIFL